MVNKDAQDDKQNELRLAVNRFLDGWHSRFVLDYWWRKKYKVPFGSEQHRQMSFIDMYIEYIEDVKIRKYQERLENEKSGIGDMTQEEIDDDYENLNLANFDASSNN